MRIPQILLAILLSAVSAQICFAQKATPEATKVNSREALEKLRVNDGISLQWIGWDRRGELEAVWRGKTLMLKGGQKSANDNGELKIDGKVISISKDRFVFRGTITINDTPDAGRKCTKTGDSIFAITQNRKYWRLREFEWCDGLTDYVDIYF